MAVNYATSLKSTRMQAVISAIDSQVSAGSLEIGTVGMGSVLVSLALSKPSFVESGGVITMQGAPKSSTASNTGTATAARIKDGAGNVVVGGLTVGTSGSDVNLNSTAITSGQTVTISSATITHSP